MQNYKWNFQNFQKIERKLFKVSFIINQLSIYKNLKRL